MALAHGLNDLVLRPRIVFDQAINNMIKVPELSGPFKIDQSKYRDQLSLPSPLALYDACKKALQLPYCAMEGIFIVNDTQVETDEAEANELIDSQSIYTSSESQAAFCQKVNNFVEAVNELSPLLKGSLLDNPSLLQLLGLDFKIIYQENRPKLAVNPDLLRRWINGIF